MQRSRAISQACRPRRWQERVALAVDHYAAGHRAFKFAAVVSHEGIVEEMAALRRAVGPEAQIMVDLHWKFTADEALVLIAALAPYRPHFVEAPVKPEDHAGLARVARESPVPIAAGEEWYTAYEVSQSSRRRDRSPSCSRRWATPASRSSAASLRWQRSRAHAIAPHATIGTGLFLAASLQVSATLPHLWKHEWQHSVFARNLRLLDSDMGYADGAYLLPTAPGLGAAPQRACGTSRSGSHEAEAQRAAQQEPDRRHHHAAGAGDFARSGRLPRARAAARTSIR